MKLLFCKNCHDVIRLFDKKRTCRCGQSSGQYVDGLNATYSGESAVPVGIANDSFAEAVSGRPENGRGKKFIAFTVPKDSPTYKFIS